MTDVARQYPWGQETQFLSVSPASRADTKSRASRKAESMWWNGCPTHTYNRLWIFATTTRMCTSGGFTQTCIKGFGTHHHDPPSHQGVKALSHMHCPMAQYMSHRWGGCSHTLHRNYLLPISNNLGQRECANLANQKSTRSMFNLPWKLSELFNPEMTLSTGADLIHKGLLDDNKTSILLRWSSKSMKYQLPRRYQNFALQQNNIFSGTFNICVVLCGCLLWWVQLYACPSTPMLPFQSDLCSEGKVPSMLIRVELNLPHWPFVWGR